jgi:hypothetical protein
MEHIVTIILENIKSLKNTPWIADSATPADATYIKKCIDESTFDTAGLQYKLYESLIEDSATLRKYSCPYGTILIVAENAYPWKFPFDTVGKILQLFWKPSSKPFRIVFFGSMVERRLPALGEPVGPQHINGGYTMPCDPGTIVVYRREEVERVLIHECFHASCSDPDIALAHKEANTEAWAELIYCALVAGGRPTTSSMTNSRNTQSLFQQRFKSLFTRQMEYSAKQAAVLAQYYMVTGPDDYAWRYTVGKLDEWRRLGFDVPETAIARKSGGSLRLTLKF